VESWRAGVHAAAQALPHPDLKAGAAVAKVHQAGTQAADRQQANAKGIPKEGAAAISLAPQAGQPPPSGPAGQDLVPEATRLVEAASNLPLGPQNLPALEESPQHNMPQIGPAPTAAAPGSAQPEKKADEAKPADAGEGKDPGREHADKVNAAAAKPPDKLDRRGPGGEFILEDKGGPSPPKPEMPPVFKASMTAVLAQLLADPRREAEQMLKQVRGAAFNGQLEQQFPHIGDDLIDDLSGSLGEQLNSIAREAGLSEQELNNAVAKRREELKEQGDAAKQEVTGTGEAEKKKVEQTGTTILELIAGTREALDEATENKLAAAKGESDPEVVRSRRERMIGGVERKVARQVVQYDEAGKNREGEIRQIASLQKIAYRNAARLDEDKLVQAAGSDEAKIKVARLTAAESRNWSDAKARALDQLVLEKKRETDGLVAARQKDVGEARGPAIEKIRLWADERLHEHRSWFVVIVQRFLDWSRAAKAEAEAWQTSKNKATAQAIAGDMNFLGGVVMTAGDQLSDEAGGSSTRSPTSSVPSSPRIMASVPTGSPSPAPRTLTTPWPRSRPACACASCRSAAARSGSNSRPSWIGPRPRTGRSSTPWAR
jgi:hypothetical protein